MIFLTPPWEGKLTAAAKHSVEVISEADLDALLGD